LLWDTGLSTVLVSATLQAGDDFARFKQRAGLPASTPTVVLPAVFDYTRGYLHEPAMECDPGAPGYEEEVARKLGIVFKHQTAKGLLVLFTSKASMARVAQLAPEPLRSRLLVQGSAPLPELLRQHKARVDAGERSVLMGLDTMAEGLDLPGEYCGHVVITRLPFAVPGDPVQAARQEAMGKDWFAHAYLADMLIALVQAAGRLIRREDDFGLITIFDRRLTTKRYGAQAKSVLPHFTQVGKISAYVKDAMARGLLPPDAPHLRLASSGEPERVRAPVRRQAPALHVVPAPARPAGTAPSTQRMRVEARIARELSQAPGHEEHATLREALRTASRGPSARHSTRAEVLLAVRQLNCPGLDEGRARWKQVFALRADLVALATEARRALAHGANIAAARKTILGVLSPLEPGLSMERVFSWLSEIEGEVVEIFRAGGDVRVPSEEVLAIVRAAGPKLERAFEVRAIIETRVAARERLAA
jgi:hypothetical protein